MENTEQNKNDMKINFDFNNVMQDFIPQDGIAENEISNIEKKIAQAIAQMKIKRENGKMAWRDLPHNQNKIVEEIIAYVNEMKDDIDNFVVLGIGGSALGPIALQQAINHPFYNELPREKRNGFPKFYVLDNIDPERLGYFLETVDINKTLFNVVSKSGNTSETMSQFMIIKDLLDKNLGPYANKHIVCTTDTSKGNLIKIAKKENYKTFYIPDGVGGRFSELCPVGLLPAAFCGIDIKKLLEGAAFMDEHSKNDDYRKNIPFMFAILNYIAYNKGKNISVMMPYADSLKFISDWYAQLWAESLGKTYDNNGNIVHVGQTPVKALGVTDQHSQIQLYNEGPFDKIVVFIGVDKYRKTINVPEIFKDVPDVSFLGGITHDDLIHVEQKATEYALSKLNRMNMTITLPEVNEFTVGQLLYMFEVATAFAGELFEINAFDQPGVEEAKNATYAMFGKPGYEEKKKELDSMPSKKSKYKI